MSPKGKPFGEKDELQPQGDGPVHSGRLAAVRPAQALARWVAERGPQILLLAAGAALLAALVLGHDEAAVLRALANARWRGLAVVAAHLPGTLCAALAWRALLEPNGRPSLPRLFRLRLIKEAVNALLPVAQVGGDVVRARLAEREGVPLKAAAASCIVDIGIGLAALVLFAMIGLVAVFATTNDARVTSIGLQLLLGAGVVAALVAVAQRIGFLKLVDHVAARSEGALGRLHGLSQAVAQLIGHRPRVVASVFWHLVSWGLGVLETYVAFWAIGLQPSFERALVLESLGQAIRGIGFAVPAGLGVQEGGYILICSSLGIPPEQALALSLLRRGRELILGVIGLLSWRNLAHRPT